METQVLRQEYKEKNKDLDAAWRQLDEYLGDLEDPPLLVSCDTPLFRLGRFAQ